MTMSKKISRGQIERERGRKEYEIASNPNLVYVPVSEQDPKGVALELQRIERDKRTLRPDDVLEAARAKDSPLHPYFDWSDGEAAEKWRRHQAGSLIASVRVILQDAPERPAMRAFLHVPANDKRGAHYGNAAKVMSDPDRRRLVLGRALSELESFQRRYAELEELAAIFRTADRVLPKLREQMEETRVM